VGRPSRTGVVRWQLKAATGPAAALRAPVPATSAPETPLAQQPALQAPWWVPSAPAVDAGLPGPRWGCGRWWSPLPEAAP
jgi:hypothetical protein